MFRDRPQAALRSPSGVTSRRQRSAAAAPTYHVPHSAYPDNRMVRNKAVCIALGVTRDGEREVLGFWIADNESARFWLSVMNELKSRGVQDILIAVVDGRKGFPEAITAAFS